MNQRKRSGRAAAWLLVSGTALALFAGPSTSLAGPDCSGRLTPAQQAKCAHSSSTSPSASPRFISANPMTQPPLHGTNPHGQGTVAVVQPNPDPNRPYSGDPTGKTDSEGIIVGRSRGEQLANGTYHGHITVAALFGNEIIGIDTTPGQTRSGPLTPLQQGLLDALCNGSGNQLCVKAVVADSTTTSTGSTNHFETAHVTVGGAATGLDTGAASSDGNISQTATCQTSTGDSQVAKVSVGGMVLADLVKSSSTSTACNDGTPPTQKNTSGVIGLGGTGVPLPAAGCANGTPNTVTGISVLLPIVCNADDTNGAQGSTPYGVREALDVFVISMGTTATLKTGTAASESLAVAPPKSNTCPAGTTGTPPNCVPTPCPKGTTGIQPNCVPTPCPVGTTGTQPNCVPLNRCNVGGDNDCVTGTGPFGPSIPENGTTDHSRDCAEGVENTTGCANQNRCNVAGDNDCVTGTGPFGPSIPEGGPTDRARDCDEGIASEGAQSCPSEGGPASARTSGTLPFTGYDVISIALVGVALLGGGFMLRRRLRRES
ncbi:MAG: hypothetical protein ACR2HD_05365 [Solirubrobacteraceae bacterium]